MPKERESELRHLGGNVLHQMHSSCAKKMTAVRQKELFEFDILSELKDLSNNADRLASETFYETALEENAGLEEWFAAIKKTMEDIRDCKNVKTVQYQPSIKTFINIKNKDEKVPSPGAIAAPALQMTMPATEEITPVKDVIASSASKMVTPNIKEITPDMKPITSDTQMVTPATSVRKKANPFVFLSQLTNQNVNVLNENSTKSNHIKLPQTALHTPVLNLTFNKINTTVVLDSGSASNSNQNSSAMSNCNDSDVKIRSVKKNNLHSTKKENDCPNSHGMLTRSGSKRKSSDSKNKSSKKQKIDSLNTSSATLKKTAQPRRPLRDLKTSVLPSENKNKLSAVIKPAVQQKQSVVSKEQQILEEIKKKEKKREENLQRVMAERQQKAEQIKKNREEKRTKTLQKRLQMEKEKEEKREIETKKSQVKVNKENAKKTTRTKELVENVKESKSSNMISSSTQNTSDANALVGTPAPRKSEDCESYELTPLPDSSTYNFSDDDEEEKPANTKRIPIWAQGVQLKSALIQQYYYPVDTDELFGSVIETPNLAQIFKINKKRYFKRTSSAVWNSPPDQPFRR